mgnify:CR=1 FL=1
MLLFNLGTWGTEIPLSPERPCCTPARGAQLDTPWLDRRRNQAASGAFDRSLRVPEAVDGSAGAAGARAAAASSRVASPVGGSAGLRSVVASDATKEEEGG